jgi:hypothetical protein
MITTYQLPEQQAELDIAIADPQPKHVWHDVPANRWLIATGDDMPQEVACE